MQISRRSLLTLIFLLGVAACLNIIVALKASITSDEAHHVDYGVRVLHFQPDRQLGGICDSQMPVSALNALPQTIGAKMLEHGFLPSVSKILIRAELARLPTILATLCLDLLVFLWACDLYGEAAGLAACLLCVLSPNLMAHGTLATTDMYHAVGVVGSLWFLRRFLLQPTWGRATFSALTLALAQTTKSFALALYLVVGVALMFAIRKRKPPLETKRAAAFVAIAAVCFVFVLNVAFTFHNSFLALKDYHFENRSFQHWQQTPVLRLMPVPVPYPFLQGLDMMKFSEKTGRSFGDVYLLGWLGDPTNRAFHGFKSYYFVALFFKEPIPLLILFVWGLTWVWCNRSRAEIAAGEGLLLAAAAILFCWMNFFSRAQIGIRHILPVLAVETVIAGAAFGDFASKTRLHKVALCLLVLWMGASVASYYPQMIPYMNEWLVDRRFSYKLLSDSNLDWGQDSSIVDNFLKKNPDVVLDPPKPVAGRVLVRANRLTGVYRWDSAAYLMKKYEPVAQVGYAHFLFVVPQSDIASGTQKR